MFDHCAGNMFGRIGCDTLVLGTSRVGSGTFGLDSVFMFRLSSRGSTLGRGSVLLGLGSGKRLELTGGDRLADCSDLI